MDARSTLKLVAFFFYVPSLVLCVSSLFLPWVTIENVDGKQIMGFEVAPSVPVFVALGATVATVIGKTRGVRRLASGTHVALGLLALAVAWSILREAQLGHATFFGVQLDAARIHAEIGLATLAVSGGMLVVSGLIEALRPHGR